MVDNIDLTGAVDLHTHVGPSSFDRRVDGFECAVEIANAGMDAVVLKKHHLPTAATTHYVGRLLDRKDADIDVVGSVVLNYCNGGFNPFVVQSAIDAGAGVVWGPTIDARNHAKKTGELGAFLGVTAGREYEDEKGIVALDEDGDIRDEVRLCVEKIADNDAVLALGHLSYEETYVIVKYADEIGHSNILIDHPNYHVTDFSCDQQRELVSLGATLNFPFLSISDEYGWSTPKTLVERIQDVGVDHCVVSSDVGQSTTPSVPESLRLLGHQLVDQGLSAADFDALVRKNPKQVLDKI